MRIKFHYDMVETFTVQRLDTAALINVSEIKPIHDFLVSTNGDYGSLAGSSLVLNNVSFDIPQDFWNVGSKIAVTGEVSGLWRSGSLLPSHRSERHVYRSNHLGGQRQVGNVASSVFVDFNNNEGRNWVDFRSLREQWGNFVIPWAPYSNYEPTSDHQVNRQLAAIPTAFDRMAFRLSTGSSRRISIRTPDDDNWFYETSPNNTRISFHEFLGMTGIVPAPIDSGFRYQYL